MRPKERRRYARRLRRLADDIEGGAPELPPRVPPHDVPPPPDPPDPPVDPPPPSDARQLIAPELEVPAKVDMIAQPGMDITDLIRAAEGSETFTLGIEGVHTQSLRLCDKYGAHWGSSPLRLRLVGMSEDAEFAGLSFHEERGFVELIEVYRMAVRTERKSAAPIWDTAPIGTGVFHRVALLPDLDPERGYNGMKWGFDLGDGQDYLHIGQCPRAVDPITGLQVNYFEHWAYLKATGRTYLTDNDISGGGRTGFQFRTPGYKDAPDGDILIEGNVCRDRGFSGEEFQGGYDYNVWESLANRLEIVGNQSLNTRGGCISIGHQPPDEPGSQKIHQGHPQHLLPSGHAHSNVLIEGNEAECKNGDRHCVAIRSSSGTLIRGNTLTGRADEADITIDTSTGEKWGAPPCTNTVIEGDHRVNHWNGETYVKWEK